MKDIILTILLSILLFSCSSYNESKNLNIKSAQSAHSKFNNMKSDFSYNEYKSLVIVYGKNSKFPDLK